MASKLVPSPMISEASLHTELPLFARPYVWPFTVLYPVFYYFYTQKYDQYFGGSEWTFVYLGSIVSLQILLWLMPFWNVEIKRTFTTARASSVQSATLIRLIPAANNGSPDICKIVRINTPDHQEVSFLFQKRRFIYDPATDQFTPPKFVIDEPTKIGYYHSASGIKSTEVAQLTRYYGLNRFDIPVPTFLELFKEHAVAPFFVFQVFCVGLWLMDELWYYSLFSLFMLIAFEFTVVWQRQRTMQEFRGMSITPYAVNVFRSGAWTEIQSDKILPGDILSVTRTKDDSGLPCDVLLLSGSAILNEAMLSGESTPLLKESIQLRPATEQLNIEDGLDKNSALYGGTKVLQVTPSSDGTHSKSIPQPPDGGVIAYVIRTGFETSQGSLVRTMIFSTERVGAENIEAYLFILFLLVFAIAASWYVWTEGVKTDRSRSKLLLDCVLIVTSVVPPELPMELTMAVNSSLSALSKFYIYCTEPFRIPFAGRVDVCCFDKTGTLTSEDLKVEGVAGLTPETEDVRALVKITDVPAETRLSMAAAHALVLLTDGEIVGDPTEKNTLKDLGWTVEKGDVVRNVSHANQKLKILRRFQFSSALKRSSSVASVDGKTLVAVKGAPETIRTFLTHVPARYEETFQSFARSGSRVLAYAYKYVDVHANKISALKREDVEAGLIFAGFLILHCPLKSDAIETVTMLKESSHRVVMITGDNPSTACHVASAVGIVDRQVLILDVPEGELENSSHDLVWRSVDESVHIPIDSSAKIDIDLFATYDLCVSGYALAKLQENATITDLLRHTWVYARVSPAQKEFILTKLKEAGYMTLMCGDGTNDVGALKQAHVGVALLNGTELGMKKMAENSKLETMKKVYDSQVAMMARWGAARVPPVPAAIAHLYPPGPSNPHYIKAIEQRGGTVDEKTRLEIELAQRSAPVVAAQKSSAIADRLTAMMDEGQEEEAPTLKLGDASVAAPFTSKLASVSSITNIVRQGRVALISTIQMYKILALNCLISAYSLSVLYLAGIKFGDGQATISGMLLSVCFLSISKGKAIEKLSKQRPQPGIFNVYIMGSILGQFAVHIVTLIYITNRVYELEPRGDVDLDAEFAPSLLNTAIYLLQLAQQISTFAVNYIGRPFREGLRENKGMYYGLLGVGALAMAGATEFMPEINEQLKLVPMLPVFKTQLCVAMIGDLVVTWAIEIVLKYYFMDSKAADIALTLEERKDYGGLVQHQQIKIR